MSIASRHRLGTLFLLNPSSEITGGVVLDAVVSRELLVALLVPEHINRIHRGAVVIRGDRVERARVPLSRATVVGRAGLGVAIAVDADTGEVRTVDRTGHVEVVGADELADVLRRHVLEAGRR